MIVTIVIPTRPPRIIKQPFKFTDISLLKMNTCIQKGYFDTHVVMSRYYSEANNMTLRRGKKTEFLSEDELYYKICKLLFFKMFEFIFQEGKINYNQIKKTGILILEKCIEINKKEAVAWEVEQPDYDRVRNRLFKNIESLMNLFLDSDLENSIKNLFKEEVNLGSYFTNVLKDFKFNNTSVALPQIDFERLEKQPYFLVYDILSINKVGDNLLDIVIMTPFDVDDFLNFRYFFICVLFKYFNAHKVKEEINDWFVDGWYSVRKIITYNPFKIKRKEFQKTDILNKIDIDLMKVISIFQQELFFKNVNAGHCKLCEHRLACGKKMRLHTSVKIREKILKGESFSTPRKYGISDVGKEEKW